MTANISSLGVDLDSLFAPHVTNNAANATGYLVAGTDIRTRYDVLANPSQFNVSSRIPGLSLTTSATGWSPNTDLASIFCGNASQYSLTTPANGTKFTSGWSSPRTWTHTITITFANATALTNYFYYGGRIQISPTQSAGTLADNTLATMFSNLGTLVIYDVGNYRTGPGGILLSPTTGGSTLGTSPVTIYSTTDGSPYTATTYSISIIANAAIGLATVLTITAVLHTVTSGTVSDVYSGTYTSNIQQRNHPTQSVPVFNSTFA